ncbi:MAG: hypothetical protein ABL921_30540 [Pirellula sp.]
MDSSGIPEIRIEDVYAFQEHVRSIESGGIPIDLGCHQVSQSSQPTLSHLSSLLARGNVRGSSIESILRNDPTIPTQYRDALIEWVKGRNASRAFAPLVGLGQRRRESIGRLASSFYQPLIILLLVYFGTMYLVQTLVPSFESIYAQLKQPPGAWLAMLIQLRDHMVIWIVGLPILVALIVLVWFVTRWRWSLSLPNRFHESAALQKAYQANHLANAIEHRSNGEVMVDQSREILSSPLMRWAMESSNEPGGQVHALRFVGHLYQESPQFRSIRWSRWLPILVSSLLGGAIVLCFALGLFGPVIELLYNLVKP